MSQRAALISGGGVSGTWAAFGGGDATSIGNVTGHTVSDTTGIRTGNNPSGAVWEGRLSVLRPPASGDPTFTMRHFVSGGTPSIDIEIYDRGTSTVVGSAIGLVPTTSATDTAAITITAASVTNWDNLGLRITATVSGGSYRFSHVYGIVANNDVGPDFVEFVRPDATHLYRYNEGLAGVSQPILIFDHVATALQQVDVGAPVFGQVAPYPEGSDTGVEFVDDSAESAAISPSVTGAGTFVFLFDAGPVVGRANAQTLFRNQSGGAAGLLALQWADSGDLNLHRRNDANQGTFTSILASPAEGALILVVAIADASGIEVYVSEDLGAFTLALSNADQTGFTTDELATGANKTGDALADFTAYCFALLDNIAYTSTNRDDLLATLSAGGGAALLKVESESVQSSESDLNVRGFLRLQAETLQIGEADLLTRDLIRILQETEQVSEGDITVRVLIRVNNESVEIAELVIPARSRLFVEDESMSVSETDLSVRGLLKVNGESVNLSEGSLSYLGFVRQQDESLSISEADLRLLDLVRLIDESVDISGQDLRFLALLRVEGEVTQITEEDLRFIDLLRIISENAEITESTIAIVAPFGTAIVKVVGESIQVSEVSLDFRALVRFISESITSDEAVLKLQSLTRVQGENVELGEGVIPARVLLRRVSEALNLFETVTFIRGLLPKIINEGVQVLESVLKTAAVAVTGTFRKWRNFAVRSRDYNPKDRDYD